MTRKSTKDIWRTRRGRGVSVALFLLSGFGIPGFVPAASAQWYLDSPPGSDFDGPAFVFEELAEGVFQARGTTNLLVGANAGIIVNQNDVVVIDSHISPAAAVALARELQSITSKPIKYVINTHFHFDHAHGNQVYPPDVQIIGHEYTYRMLANGGSTGRTYEMFRGWIADFPGGDEGQQGLVPTPPNTTLSQRMTLVRDGREIQLLFFGRGHTGGDVVVYLPAEKILFSGDLLLEGVPFMGDGFLPEWIDTLGELARLDFEVVVPGHGLPFSDRARIGRLQHLLSRLWDRTMQACDQGIAAEAAAGEIDVSDLSQDYPSLAETGVPLVTVERIYELSGCGNRGE